MGAAIVTTNPLLAMDVPGDDALQRRAPQYQKIESDYLKNSDDPFTTTVEVLRDMLKGVKQSTGTDFEYPIVIDNQPFKIMLDVWADELMKPLDESSRLCRPSEAFPAKYQDFKETSYCFPNDEPVTFGKVRRGPYWCALLCPSKSHSYLITIKPGH